MAHDPYLARSGDFLNRTVKGRFAEASPLIKASAASLVAPALLDKWVSMVGKPPKAASIRLSELCVYMCAKKLALNKSKHGL